MKKFAALILALTLCLGAACAQAFSMTGLETETVTREWETNLFFQRMTELTGIETTQKAVYDAEDYAKLIAGMKPGALPADVLFKANLSRTQEITLLDSGALIDLAPLIEENMPNLSALLEANPEWMTSIALEDGRIASLPLINEAERQVCVWINKAWLDKLGVAMPETIDELTAALIRIKDADPNANYKNDEVPADLLGVFEMRWLLPYFSVIADDYHLARDAQGGFVFAPEQAGYRDFVALLKSWNDLGLLRSDAFTGVHNAAVMEKTDNETIVSGMIVTVAPYTHITGTGSKDYVPLLMAGPDGSTRWRDMLGEIWTGCFAVTADCKDPAEALRWADALYGEEGAVLAYAGKEDEEYSFDQSGAWVFNVDAMRTIDDIRADAIIYTGTATPGISPAEFLSKVDSDIDQHILACMKDVRAVSEQVSPAHLLGEQAQKRANDIALVLGRLVDEGIARFATGEVELTDENWNAWLETLRGAGSDELVSLFNAALK